MVTKFSIPLSSETVPLETATVQVLFTQAFAQLMQKLRQWFLPHFIGAIGLFLLMAYVTSFTLFTHTTSVWRWLGTLIVLSGYGIVAICYSLFTTSVLALRLVCVGWDDFIENILLLVQKRVACHIADLNMGISKAEATQVIRGSVSEVFSSIKTQQTGFSRGFMILCLGLLATAVRTVLSAKIVKWSGRTIQLGKLFAGKTTLVGAVFLNLHVFATLLLVVCYACGFMALAVNIYFVILFK